MKQCDAKHLFAIDCDSLLREFIRQQHRSHADAKGMRGHGFGAVGKTTQGPTGTVQALEALQLDENGKHRSYWSRKTYCTARTMIVRRRSPSVRVNGLSN